MAGKQRRDSIAAALMAQSPMAQQRVQDIASYNELVPPLPQADPRGQDIRDAQIRQQEMEDYDQLVNPRRYHRPGGPF